MSTPTCPRSFEVEAARDGRLRGAELQRFEAHVSRCDACAREAAELEDLARALRALPDIAADELHARRERTRLLAAFDAALVPSAARGASTSRRWLVPLIVTATLTTLCLLLWHSRAPSPGAAPVAALPSDPISVEAHPGARWSRQVEAHRETITLASGTLSIAIDHTRSPRRLRVLLPDGDLEDLGTTFSVSARAGATTHVAVREGAVILRLRDRAPIVLNAQQAWSPDAARAPEPPAAPSAASVAPAVSARRSPVPVSSAPSVALTPATPSDAASDFRAALAALNGGDNALAAQRFSGFLTRHAGAPNAEDAAYLRVIALQRTGNLAATRSAAIDYLERYPAAFRRAEIEPLSR